MTSPCRNTPVSLEIALTMDRVPQERTSLSNAAGEVRPIPLLCGLAAHNYFRISPGAKTPLRLKLITENNFSTR